MRPKYFHHYVGGNFRIDALQAAILHVKLKHLDSWTEGRQRNAAIYREIFAASKVGDRVILPKELEQRRHIYNQFVIRFPEGKAMRDSVMARLKEAAIGCEVYYPLTLPAQKCFADFPSAHERFPVSEAAADQSLAIPIYPELKRDQIEKVVEAIASA